MPVEGPCSKACLARLKFFSHFIFCRRVVPAGMPEEGDGFPGTGVKVDVSALMGAGTRAWDL